MKRKIKNSRRGLTFTAPSMSIGSHFRYLIDKTKKEVVIIPDENGTNTVSKKKCGKNIKPLIDLRSEEIRDLVSKADYIELQVLKNGNVLARTVRKAVVNRSEVISIKEILESRASEFIIPAKMLAVSGGSYPTSLFGHATLAEDSYFSYLADSAVRKTPGKKEIDRIYNVISLFSGAGMLDKAFLNGRFNFVYGVDFEKAAVETYKANIGNHIECRDIKEVDPDQIPDAELIIGGPCCQAYSNANRHNMETETAEKKRLLVDDYARIVRRKHPKVWVVENVPELLSREDGFYFNRLCDSLSDYEVIADDEAGGYSKRRRAVVIGSRIGKIQLPKIKVVTSATVRDALSKVDASWYNYKDVTMPKEETAKKMSFVPQGGNWKDIPAPYNTYGPKTHSSIMRRLKWDEPSITLTNFRKSNRTLTVAEAAAIMGLDKSFKFLGTLSEKQQMCANGVTQAIGKLIRSAVLKALDSCSAKPVAAFN